MGIPIATTIEAASAAAMIASWVFGIGRYTAKLEMLTKATEKLAAVFEKHTEKSDATLADHETRITVLEKAKR